MSPAKRVVGIDVGGANLKLAAWQGSAEPICISEAFPLWKQPEQLAARVAGLLESFGAVEALAVTMTGELADCYATRREGVDHILSQLATVIPPDRIGVYAVGGDWLSVKDAVNDPWRVAASNWYALADWLGQWPATAEHCRHGLIVDIGSTTVDVVPMIDGQCATEARTDRQRLEQRQLVYTGVRRTPVCAITPTFSLDSRTIPVMAEFFATADDAYLALEQVDEDAEDNDTADGRPRQAAWARARLARMIGEDSESLTSADTLALASQIVAAQARQVAEAIEFNLDRLARRIAVDDRPQPTITFTGHGAPLFRAAQALLRSPHQTFELGSILDPAASRCAPALAVAYLLAQHRALV